MILALLAVALPGVFWDQGPETADTLRSAGIEQIYVVPARLNAWRGQTGIEVRPVDLVKATKLSTPGVDFRMNRASATRSPWITANGWEVLRSPETLLHYEVEGPVSALAAAEAFAYGARAMIAPDAAGLEPLRRMLDFLQGLGQPELPVFADIGVVDDGSFETGELMTMLVRGNLLYRIVEAPDPELKLNVQLGTPEYPVEQAAEPHVLAAKVRSNLTDEKRSLRIYGSTVVVGHAVGNSERLRLHLLNYAGTERPVNGIRVRVLGRYSKQNVAAAGVEDPRLMDVRVLEDATEFTLPEMKTYAVVDLFR
jgi:hypothetical protein